MMARKMSKSPKLAGVEVKKTQSITSNKPISMRIELRGEAPKSKFI
jgi:hypothetical protein